MREALFVLCRLTCYQSTVTNYHFHAVTVHANPKQHPNPNPHKVRQNDLQQAGRCFPVVQ